MSNNSLCKQLGELISGHLRDNKQALIVYKEALNYDEANADVSHVFHYYNYKS